MMKTLFAFLLSLYTANVFAAYGGNIGAHDDRVYSSLADQNYRGVVRFFDKHGTFCTGTFITKNLVLTNSHCALLCKNGCAIEFYNGSEYEKSNLKIVAYYENFEVLAGNDWALLVSDKESKFFVPVVSRTTNGSVLAGGFGMLRIIKDEEIPFLKKLYVETDKEFRSECKKEQIYYACINKHVEKKLKDMGRKPLFNDGENFKIQNCKITGSHPKSQNMIKTDCDAAGGNSGGGLLRNKQLVGLVNSVVMDVFYEEDEVSGATGLKTENFYNNSQKYIKKYEQSSVTGNNNNDSGGNNSSNQQPSKPNTNSNNSNSGGNNSSNQQPSKPNTNNNNNDTSGQMYDDPQKIEEILQQKLQDFNCD